MMTPMSWQDNNMHKKNTDIASPKNRTKQLALTGLLFAAALVLSLVENALPPLIPVPGVKLGLPNIIVMHSLFFLDKGRAYAIMALKALFVVITRGPIAGLLSFCGGFLSITVMVILLYIGKERISYLLISICGAVSHNLGQYIAICIIYTSLNLWVYLPVLVIAGVIAGIVTATLLRFVMPALKKTGLL